MLKELVIIIGGIKIYAEADESKHSLMKTVVSMIRKAFQPKVEREVA